MAGAREQSAVTVPLIEGYLVCFPARAFSFIGRLFFCKLEWLGILLILI